MSRSRKKSTFVTDNHGRGEGRRFMKRYSNKSFRNKLKNSDELIQGSQYKKHFESYDICDYKWYWSEDMAIDDYNRRIEEGRKSGWIWFEKRYPTLKSWMKYYRKCVVYK